MTNYLIRRVFQMIVVILLAAVFVYFLFNISPGGPLAGIQQQQRASPATTSHACACSTSWTCTGRCLLAAGWSASRRPHHRRRPRDVRRHPRRLLPAALRGDQRGSSAVGCDEYVYLSELPELHPAIGRARASCAATSASRPSSRTPPGQRAARQPRRSDLAHVDFAAAVPAARRADRHLQRRQAVLQASTTSLRPSRSSARPCRPSSLPCC